jgi:hypothetical protein
MSFQRPAARTRTGALRPVLSAALCASLIALSPGLESYAAAAGVVRVQAAGASAPLSGPVGQGRGASSWTVPASLSLAPAALTGAIHTAPAAPSVAADLQVQAGLQTQASPSIPQAGPLSGPGIQAVPTAALPLGIVPAHDAAAAPKEVLETGVERISRARNSSSLRLVLEEIFTGGKTQAGDDTGVLAQAKVYLTQAGQAPVAATLADLGETLSADPALKDTFNKTGRVRIVLSKDNPRGGLTRNDVTKVQASLAAHGITAKLEVETLPVAWDRGRSRIPQVLAQPPPEQKPPSAASKSRLLSLLTSPFRELAYLARVFLASYTDPSLRELLASTALKLVIPLIVLSQTGWIAMYDGHPLAKFLVLSLTIGLNMFHGAWVRTWANLQNHIGRQRGVNYQSAFNLVYSQVWSVLYRLIAYSAIPGTVPPWSLKYWKDMGIATLIGTFVGTLAFQGVNSLYNKGRLNQWQRSAILLTRDLVLCLASTFFGSGSMAVFWTVFAAQQALDFGIYLYSRSRWAGRRPILYVADEMVAAAPEFQDMYPVGPDSGREESPLRQAVRGLLETPLIRPIVWLVRKLRGILARIE